MEDRIILRANIKRHRGTMAGIILLTAAVSFALAAVLTLWINSQMYIRSEIKRAGYGALTMWVSGVPETEAAEYKKNSGIAMLSQEMEALPEVERVSVQTVIFADYEINGKESDSEGQLIFYEAGKTSDQDTKIGKVKEGNVQNPDAGKAENSRYRFFTDSLDGYQKNVPMILPGEVYVSPSMISVFDAKIGDSVIFPMARGGKKKEFRIKGYYEDPFMGSSMIGMKGFLVCAEDVQAMQEQIRSTGIDALARDGAMLHIFPEAEGSAKEKAFFQSTKPKDRKNEITASALSTVLAEKTGVSPFLEFAHSENAIAGFMLVLQTAYCGLFLAFVLVLLVVVLVVLRYSIGGNIELEWKELGIYNTMGFTAGKLRRMMAVQYLSGIVFGMLAGILAAAGLGRFLGRATLYTTGILIPGQLPLKQCLLVYLWMLLLLFWFIWRKTGAIGRVSPMEAIRGEMRSVKSRDVKGKRSLPAIHGNVLLASLALRQLVSGRRRYFAAGMTAMFLVFIASLTGRMNTWLGADGKGMMDAFNPADHDLGIQALGRVPLSEMVDLAASFTKITDQYALAMPNVTVEGSVYTANVITEPGRFHILSGQTAVKEDEVVVTETVAKDLGVAVGESVRIQGNQGSNTYRISGIYQCANAMGANIGMNREGYLLIGGDDERLWCSHLFLEDASKKAEIREALEKRYGGDVHVHENSWPGLLGIIAAMKILLALLSVGIMLFIAVVTGMTAGKVLRAEQRELGILKAIGFSEGKLRLVFALRFIFAAGAGAVLGLGMAAVLTDPLVGAVMRLAGISDFTSHMTIENGLLIWAAVVALFGGFAWIFSGKIRRVELAVLVSE